MKYASSDTFSDLLSRFWPAVLLCGNASGKENVANTKIALQNLKNGPHFVVETRVNGESPTLWILDTGAQASVVSQSYATRLKLQTEEMDIATDSGGYDTPAPQTTLRTLEVGAHKRSNVEAYILPLPGGIEEEGIMGVLSPQSFFSDLPFFIDGPSKLLLADKEADQAVTHRQRISTHMLFPCEGIPVHDTYMIEGTFNEIPGRFYLDTGGSRAALNPNYAAKLGNLRTTKDMRAGVASSRVVKRIERLSFSAGALQGEISADIEPKSVSCKAADGKLGNDFLGQFGLYFSRDRKELVFYK
jgi:predicted aspartyl protease